MNINMKRKLNSIMAKSGSGMEAEYMKESIKNSFNRAYEVNR